MFELGKNSLMNFVTIQAVDRRVRIHLMQGFEHRTSPAIPQSSHEQERYALTFCHDILLYVEVFEDNSCASGDAEEGLVGDARGNACNVRDERVDVFEERPPPVIMMPFR